MSNLRTIKYRFGRAWLSGAMILLSLYFCIHLFEGDSGLKALNELEVQHGALSLRSDLVSGDRAILEQRVALLRSDAIDPDMLEEQARARLGFSHPDDVVIFD